MRKSIAIYRRRKEPRGRLLFFCANGVRIYRDVTDYCLAILLELRVIMVDMVSDCGLMK